MKILFVIPEYPPYSGGGISTFYKYVLSELLRYGFNIHVLVGSAFTSKQKEYELEGITVKFLDSNSVTYNLKKFDRYRAIPEFQRHLAAAWTAWEQVNGGQEYDLVETTDWGLLFVPWIASPDGPPTVVQLHASIGQIDFHDPQLDSQLQGNLVRLLEAALLSGADELQTYSRTNAEFWQQLTGRGVTYIPPALHLTPNLLPNEKSQRGLVVGRIQYWKGPTTLCEALRLLDSKAPAIDWLGRDTVYQDSGSSMLSYLKQTYSDIWGTKIRPLGTLPPKDTAKLQAQAGFMVVPSIWDVFNYTCAEGMAQAQTVLCSKGAGASDLITDGLDGMTFAAGDPEALAASLEALLSLSPSQRSQMGQAARHTIETKLAPAQIAQQRIEAYEKLLQRGRFPLRPNSWLLDAVSSGQLLEQPLAFLNYLPLKEISRYVLQRSLKKIKK
ncbi:MAG: hypothetical protein Kow00121_09160 [Elainellaceae cyanobacterium]